MRVSWHCSFCTLQTKAKVSHVVEDDGKAWCPTIGMWVKDEASLQGAHYVGR